MLEVRKNEDETAELSLYTPELQLGHLDDHLLYKVLGDGISQKILFGEDSVSMDRILAT